MNRFLRCTPPVGVCALSTIAALITLAPTSDVAANDPVTMRVEEDWQAVLTEPDDSIDSPQFHTMISPTAATNSFYFQTLWNYQERPEFNNGGLQLLAWNGELSAGSKIYREDPLSAAAETVYWTQSLDARNNSLTYSIENGSSQTWGAFGGSGSTALSGRVSISNLNGYSTDVSASQSWVSYGGNRVESLRIVEVRRYDGDGHLISRDTTPRTVFEYADQEDDGGAGEN